jgi:cytochrome c oxidase cbb3-type subunit 3
MLNLSPNFGPYCRSDSSPGHGPHGCRANLLVFCCLLLCFSLRGTVYSQEHSPNYGAQRFVEYCAGCHGADGRGGGKAGSITTQRIIALSDEELTRIVSNGSPSGMPPFAQIGDANIGSVIFYLRTLQGKASPTNAAAATTVTGDAAAGRALFFGKAQCSTCHMVGGEGGFIAPELTDYGDGRTADSILHAILMPDEPLNLSSRVVEVTTNAGQKLSGVVRNEDNFNLTLQTEDGRYYSFARNNLKDVHYTDHSLMPRNYGTRLTPAELNDIASFLIVSGRSAGAEAAQSR